MGWYSFGDGGGCWWWTLTLMDSSFLLLLFCFMLMLDIDVFFFIIHCITDCLTRRTKTDTDTLSKKYVYSLLFLILRTSTRQVRLFSGMTHYEFELLRYKIRTPSWPAPLTSLSSKGQRHSSSKHTFICIYSFNRCHYSQILDQYRHDNCEIEKNLLK